LFEVAEHATTGEAKRAPAGSLVDARFNAGVGQDIAHPGAGELAAKA